ncbi:MAG TPA: AAA family ATPase, partial [Pseudonocardiaceae bacterium]|nr:AAA family ATPase [Pseudonocardiaceae bacterium]
MRIRTPLLVGRDEELCVVTDALGDTHDGRGKGIFVVGEPGVGKSRLAAEAASRALVAGMVVLRGRSSTVGPMMPFRPFAEAVLSGMRHRNMLSDRDLGPYGPVLRQFMPDRGARPVLAGGVSLVVLAEAVLHLMAVVGRDRGCLLILEDLHDADIETLGVLDYLTDHLAQGSSVLLVTSRDEPCTALDICRSAAHRQMGDLVELDRLDYVEMSLLVASCLEVAVGELPPALLSQLWAKTLGNPFMVEELLNGMLGGRQLALNAPAWHEAAGQMMIPATIVKAITHRTDRLGAHGRELLSAAAVLGSRFPLSVAQKVTGLDDHTLLTELHACVTAQMISADERGPDWYAFQHPLIADALLTTMTPVERATFSRRAAEAIELTHPELPGEWCQLSASLRLAAGDLPAAARLFAEAGRRALAESAAGSAIALLEQADGLLERQGDQAGRVELLETLLYALAEAGLFTRAFQLATTLEAGGFGLDAGRRVAIHVRLAWVAHVAGRHDDCAAQVAEARIALGDDVREELSAPVDAIAAYLALELPGHDRLDKAERLARCAIGPAERIPLPVIACQAWYAIGLIVRGSDIGEADAALRRCQLLAEEHHLPIWRLYGVGGRAVSAWLAEGTADSLRWAQQEAQRVGAVAVALNMEGMLALHTVLTGDIEDATTRIDTCLDSVRRFGLLAMERYLLMTRAVAAAHQGRRASMDEALAEFDLRGGQNCRELTLSLGLGKVFCALLEENADRAGHELDEVVALEDANPVTFHLSGRNGLYWLLRALSGQLNLRTLRQRAAGGAHHMRWNRHFVELANAVLLGREGQPDQAEAMMARAQQSATPYVMARHLGLRLVANHALADGWGSPTLWLRDAEEYFYQTKVTAVTGACRALLRQAGEAAPQRRDGTGRVPAELRARGVTLREFEVLELLIQRLGNRDIATRLHISARTAEKHVASLL